MLYLKYVMFHNGIITYINIFSIYNIGSEMNKSIQNPYLKIKECLGRKALYNQKTYLEKRVHILLYVWFLERCSFIQRSVFHNKRKEQAYKHAL